jgi:hypothetical protein
MNSQRLKPAISAPLPGAEPAIGLAGADPYYPPCARLGLDFAARADPRRFRDDPALAWGFYGHRLGLYRRAPSAPRPVIDSISMEPVTPGDPSASGDAILDRRALSTYPRQSRSGRAAPSRSFRLPVMRSP